MKLGECSDMIKKYKRKHGDARVLVQGFNAGQYFVLQDVVTVEDTTGVSIVLKHSKSTIKETLVKSMNKDYSTISYSY